MGLDAPAVANPFASGTAGADGGRCARPIPGGVVAGRGQPIAPRLVDSGPVQEVVLTGERADAGALPISRDFAQDAGRYVGGGILVCRDRIGGVRNFSYQRLQLKDGRRFWASLHLARPYLGRPATCRSAPAEPRSGPW